ncbi:MAG: S41 family peptidase [Ruminococcaceae bacterium]|nr:S41 family peptidase [Oscillospiraceae bacterium]
MKKIIALLLMMSIVISLSGCLMTVQERETISVPSIAEVTGSYQSKVDEIIDLFDTYYVDEYETENLDDYLAAAAVAASGDRWSGYMTADEYAASLEEDNNAYVGIGVTVQLVNDDDEGFTIIDVTPNGAAMEAGVEINDMIVAVEGQNAIELGMDGLKKMIRGEEGTDVTITFLRDGETFDLTITRKQIDIQVLEYELLEDGVGYIKLAQFTKNTASMTIAAIEYLQEEGATSLVFDMRFNPGGFKYELVTLLDYLLPEGPLFRSVDYTGKEEVDKSDENCLEMPMAVLINEDSYSAAEFFAAALQEYKWATIVGTQTTGKANYQETFVLSDGSAVRISTGHYQTPNGVTLEGLGVTPDIVVEVDDETYYDIYYDRAEDDPQLDAAISAVKK